MTTADTTKLMERANELRTGMIEALGASEDAKVRKLGNELATVNKEILDAEAGAQSDARTEYMGSMHDALNAFEMDGQTLTVRFSIDDGGKETLSIAFEPVPDTIELIKTAIAGIERPTTATRWTYGRDEEGHQAFDFGRGARKTGSPQPNGSTRSTGWSKDGVDISLGDAFDACATAAEKTERDAKTTGSQKYSVQVRVVKAHGYTKS